jgi:hypothetical protein
MAEKEAWPGAGIDWDWINLQKSDVVRIEQHVNQMPDTKTRLEWLDMLVIEFKYWDSRVPDRDVVKALWETWSRLRDRWTHRANLERRIANESAPEIEDEEEGAGEWTNSIKGLALYALLRFADLPKGFNQTAAAKFAATTRRSSKSTAGNIRKTTDLANCGQGQAKTLPTAIARAYGRMETS